MADIRYTQDKPRYGGFSEDIVESAAVDHICDLGWTFLDPADIAPDGPKRERASYGDAIIPKLVSGEIRLKDAEEIAEAAE